MDEIERYPEEQKSVVPEQSPNNQVVESVSFKKYVVIFILGSFAIYIGYSSLHFQPSKPIGKNNEYLNQKTNTVSVIPTPTINITNWKTYTDTKYGYSFKYPDNFVVMTPKDLDYIGTGWDTFYFIPNTIQSPTTLDVKIELDNIDKVQRQGEITPEKNGVKDYFDNFHKLTPEPDNNLENKASIKVKNFIVNNHKAIEMHSIGMMGNQTQNYYSKEIYINKNDSLIIKIGTVVVIQSMTQKETEFISGVPSNFGFNYTYNKKDKSSLDAILDQILLTFKFIN